MDSVHVYTAKASQEHNLWKEYSKSDWKAVRNTLQMSWVLRQYHKHLLVIFLYIHVYRPFNWLEMKKKKSNPDFSISSCKVHREKKWWMIGHECLHAPLLRKWPVTLYGLEPSHGPAWCVYMNLWGEKTTTLKLRIWNGMCKKLSGSWVLTYYQEDALLWWGNKNIPENAPIRCVMTPSRPLA